jgi:C4-dicarboxylate transporter DctM subunit
VVGLPVPNAVIVAIILLIYVIGGMIMDALALLLITIPIFFPVAEKLGYDPIWFGVLITVVTTLGAVTPPVGATSYIVGGMAKNVNLEEVFRGVAYFIPAYLICLLLLMLFPQLILFLPNLIR